MQKPFASLAAAFVAAPAQPQSIPPAATTMIEPSGKWAVEYDQWRCLLHREFTTAGKRVLLSLSREPLAPKAWLKVAIEGEAGERDDGNAVLFVDGQRNSAPLHYNYYKAERFEMREFWLDLAEHQPGSIKNRARFWTPKHGDIEMNVAGFPAAWTALSKCMADLNGELGISEADVAPMVTAPDGWALSAIDRDRTSELEYVALYWVNAEGRVDECKLLKPSGQKKIDDSFCAQLKAKGKFKPARDAANRPIRVPVFDHMQLRTQIIYSDRPLIIEDLKKKKPVE